MQGCQDRRDMKAGEVRQHDALAAAQADQQMETQA